MSQAVLQAATIIAKTTQTLIGSEIDVTNGTKLTIHFAYTKGDETGVKITPYFLDRVGGTKYQVQDWAATSGAYVGSPASITLTASKTASIAYDVSGVYGFRLEAAGSNNDGTPTGTLAASYSLK